MTDLKNMEGVQLGVVETYDDVQTFMSWLGERRPVLAYDSETAGLNPWARDARIRLGQFGDAMTGWTIPWHLWPGLVEHVFRTYKGPMTVHNEAFDAKYHSVVCPEIPWPWRKIDDTMIMARLAEPHRSAALKRISDAVVDPNASLGQKALKVAMDDNKWTWNTVPMDYDGYTLYGAMDTVLGARVWEHFQPWVRSHFSVYDLEMQVRRICTMMELKGIRVDREYSRQKRYDLSMFVEECMSWAETAYDLQIGSTRQLSKWVIDNGGVIDDFTPAGFPKMDKDMLKKLIIEPLTPDYVRVVCETALKCRKADKMSGTYFKNFLEFSEDTDGILHPDINTLAARTSRMSITNPALQTLSKQNADVRDAFIPMSEDEVLVTCDSDQIESRLFANFSNDTSFQRAFDEGDFFVNIARQVYSDSTLVKSDPRRVTIKTYWYAKLYGAGLAKMALSAGVPYPTMAAIDKSMNIQFPGIKSFQTDTINRAMREGKIVTPTGRELVIEDPSKAYVAVNYALQGHAAEALKMALVNMDNSGIGDFLMIPVHDEVVASVPRDLAEDVAKVMEDCMTFNDPDLYPVPLTASAEGPYERWGDKIRAAA